jgi:hypothetical protein
MTESRQPELHVAYVRSASKINLFQLKIEFFRRSLLFDRTNGWTLSSGRMLQPTKWDSSVGIVFVVED